LSAVVEEEDTDGAVESASIVKDNIVSVLLGVPEEFVTIIVQSV